MLTEEAHHMYVGETGVARIIQKACDVMNKYKTDDVRKHGAIDLPTLQKYVNFHFSVSEDLFGAELSTNAANYFTQGLKGRYQEQFIKDDHSLKDEPYEITTFANNMLKKEEVPALNSINERLRDDYIKDCQRGINRWNKLIKDAGIDFEITLPHRAFHRQIGAFAKANVSPEGVTMTEEEWNKNSPSWLPSDKDHGYVKSLMTQVTEPGKFASWIAPPRIGINNQAIDFEYVRL
jgi:benzoyl-CoA 2,3-dioxygenase component B